MADKIKDATSISPLACIKLFFTATAATILSYFILRLILITTPSKELLGTIQSIFLSLFSILALNRAGVDVKASFAHYNTLAYASIKQALSFLLILLGAGLGIVSIILLIDFAFSRLGIMPADMLEHMLFPGVALKNHLTGLYSSPAQLILFVLTTWVLAPIGEELFFRRLFYSGLRRQHTFLKSATISSILFGAFHGMNWFPVFTKSMLISYFYEKNQNILSAVFLHSFINILATLIFVL